MSMGLEALEVLPVVQHHLPGPGDRAVRVERVTLQSHRDALVNPTANEEPGQRGLHEFPQNVASPVTARAEQLALEGGEQMNRAHAHSMQVASDTLMSLTTPLSNRHNGVTGGPYSGRLNGPVVTPPGPDLL